MDLQSQYFAKAEQAYLGKEYKYCLILLRKVSLDEYSAVSLLVNCAYDYWKATVVGLASSKAVSRVTSRPGSAVTKHANPQSIGQLMSTNDEYSPEFDTVLKAIKESFTKLLANVKVVPIKQYDYVRLTHVYLAEGSLAGALQIMQLASARGFLEDPLVILQSWSIMKRISSETEAVRVMVFLVSTLVIEASQRKRTTHSRQGGRTNKADRISTSFSHTSSTNINKSIQSIKGFATTVLSLKFPGAFIPLPEVDPSRKASFVSDSDFPSEYLYLFCASFVHKEAIKNKHVQVEYRRNLGELASILSEAYFLATGVTNEDAVSLNAWFNNPYLWRTMAEKLDIHTPYVLLAQECYWEAFVRSPLEEYHIVAHISSLIRNKTKSEVPSLLARAMEVNPWNLFVRNALYELDCELVVDPAQRQWAELFLHDDQCAVKVQCTVRGWRLRLHWDGIRQRLTLRKQRYADRKSRALHKGFLIWQGHLRLCMRGWRVYIEDWKQLKYVSATLIQAHARGRMWRVWYAWRKQQIAYANGLFLCVHSKIRDKRRFDRFAHWYAMHMQLVRRRSADLITQVLFMTGYSRLLRNGMDFILTVMRVKKKHMYKRMIKHWNEKMHDRRLRRARVTIRFFVRGIYQKKVMAAKEEQLAQVMQAIVEKSQGPDFRKNNLPLLRAKWDHWFTLYKRIVTAQTILKLSFMLARTFFRMRGRAIRRGLRARVEAQLAFVRSTWYHKVNNIFTPWRLHAGAQKIQRAVRVRHARKVYKRLLLIASGVEEKLLKKQEAVYAQVMNRWHKHNFLLRREKIRASWRIVKLFRLIVVRGTVRRKCAAKVALSQFIDVFHQNHLRLCLRRLKAATIYASRFIIVGKMVNSLRKGTLRAGFYIWARLFSAQKAMDRLLYVRAVRPLEKQFWVGACMSVALKALEVPSMENTVGEWIRPRQTHDLMTASTNSFYLTNGEPSDATGEQSNFIRLAQKLRSADLMHDLATMVASCHAKDSKYKTFETVVPTKPIVFFDLHALKTARAFKSWMACFRLRQRYLRGVLNPLSERLMQDVTRTVLARISAAFIIQNRFRSCNARIYARALLEKRRRCDEISTIIASRINSRLLQKTWCAMINIRHHLSAAAMVIQSMVRVHRAWVRYKAADVQHQGLQDRAKKVRTLSKRLISAKFLHHFQLAYCRAVHKTLISSRNAEFTRSNRTLSRSMTKSGTHDEFTEGGLEKATFMRESKSAQFGTGGRPTLQREHSHSTDSFSHQPAQQPDVFERLARVNKALANPHKRNKNADNAKQSFVSEECRQHLLRLHQTGVFIFDSSNTPLSATQINPKMSTFKKLMALQAEEQLHPQLTNEELEFCLQNAIAVFCQHTRKAALRCVVNHFSGAKLVLRGGELATNTVASLLFPYLRQHTVDLNPANASTITNTRDENNVPQQQERPPLMSPDEDSLILHFVSVTMGVSARLALVRSLIDLPGSPGEEQRCCRVGELAVDTDSFGLLGTAVLLRALQFNAHLRVLSVQCSGDTREGEGYLPCFGESLLLLSENKSLQELKFFGAVLTLPMLEGLLDGLRSGFAALRVLEFPIDLSSGFATAPASVASTATQTPRTQGIVQGPPPSVVPAATTDPHSHQHKKGAPLKHGKMFEKGYANEAPAPRKTCVSLAENIVEAAKARAYAGRNGLSVTVNYR